MRITTLGTGHGLSERDRYCTTTMVEMDGKRYLVDVGAPVDYLFVNQGWRMSDLRAVMLTHMHCDHVGLLPPLVENLTCLSGYLKKREGVEELPPCSVVFPTEEGLTAFLSWMQALGNSLTDDATHPFAKGSQLSFAVAREDVLYDDGCVRFLGLRTAHMKDGSASFAYLMEAEGKRVLFTGDVSRDLHDLRGIFSAYEFDAVVCEFTHFLPEAAMEVLCSAKTNKMIFNHICGYEGERPAWIEAHRDEFPFSVVAATDGAVFEI